MIDHRFSKALYLKGKALMEMTEYVKALEALRDLVEFDPNNEEGKRELQRAENIYKKYQDKEKDMFKKMFSN